MKASIHGQVHYHQQLVLPRSPTFIAIFGGVELIVEDPRLDLRSVNSLAPSHVEDGSMSI
jgi:hypothetical protein